MIKIANVYIFSKGYENISLCIIRSPSVDPIESYRETDEYRCMVTKSYDFDRKVLEHQNTNFIARNKGVGHVT